MTLPASGTLSIQQINAEFGRGNNLNAYRGTTWYTDAGGSGTFPTGAISISDFYGKRLTSPTFSFTISSHQDRANLRTLALNAGWNGSSAVVATLASGVWIYSASTGQAALTINGSFPNGVTFINNGYVVGMGGNGGGGGTSSVAGAAGGGGGTALSIGVAVTVYNYGYIAGGGGGGGGGGGYISYTVTYGGGGGGGGQTGLANSGGGAGGAGAYPGNAGGAGTSSGPGAGGVNTSVTAIYGGGGGGWGAAGGAGGGSGNTTAGGGGGAAGYCTSGGAYITWGATGNRYGPLG